MTRRLPVLHGLFLWTILASVLTHSAFAIGFDPTFGSGGKFMTSFSDVGDPSSEATDIFIQPSGRIVVIGNHSHVGPTGGRFGGIALAGLTPAGFLDNSFGSGGKVLLWEPPVHRFLNSALVQPDGSILLLCRFFESSTSERPAIVKYTANGQPDPTFDANINLFPNPTFPTALALGNGGKIYVAVRDRFQHYVVRLNANGSRDTTFGPDGVRSVNLNRFASQQHMFALEELANGQLLIAGTYRTAAFEDQTFIARLNSDTTLDLSFGRQGAVRLAIPNGSVDARTMRVQPDGKILIGGSWTFLGSTTLLVRLTARGRLDRDFGNSGFAQTSFNDWNILSGIAPAPDGTLFVAGICGEKALPSNQRLFVIRYSSTGTILTSVVTNFIGDRDAGASEIRLQADGKLLIGGFTQNLFDADRQLAAARFNQ